MIFNNHNFKFCLLKKRAKIPFEKDWQVNGYDWNDNKLKEHIQNGGNAGIIGGYDNLRIIDADNETFAEEIKNKLETFTVKTGSGGKHFYIQSDYDKNHVFIKELGEYRADRYQVVIPGSTHPNGNKYIIDRDLPIAKLSSEEVLNLIEPYLRNNKITDTNSSPLSNQIENDTSRSAREYREIIKLIRKKLSKEEVFSNMMAFSKWSSAHPAYREMTYQKALDFVEEKKLSKISINGKLMIDNFSENAKEFYKVQPYFYDKSGMFWFWQFDRCCYEIVDDIELMSAFDDVLGFMGQTVNSGLKSNYMEAFKREGRNHIPQNLDKSFVQFDDEIVNVFTTEKKIATPDLFVTNPIPWKIGKETDTRTIDKLFGEWVGEDKKDVLYEILAYSCLPDYPLHRIFCFTGSGLNGKGTFLNLLIRFIGKENSIGTDLDVLLSSRFEVTKLHKRLIALMGETNFSEMKKTSLLKRLSGQDLIGFEYKNKNPFDDYNYAKLIISTNSLPATTDKSRGFYRRWMIINFPNEFSEKRDVLATIPDKEYNNLANKIIPILQKLLQNREFCHEGSIDDREKAYEDASNPLQRFLKDETTKDSDGFIFKFEFRDRFDTYQREHGYRVWTETEIGLKMKKDYNFEDGKRGKESYNSWLGLKWKSKRELVVSEISTPSRVSTPKPYFSPIYTKSGLTPRNPGNPGEEELYNFIKSSSINDNFFKIVEKFGESFVMEQLKIGNLFESPKGTLRVTE